MPCEERNEKSTLDIVVGLVRYANEHAFDSDAVDLSRCYSKNRRNKETEAYKTYAFLTKYDIKTEDIRNVLSEISVGQYSYTSVKPDCPNAYVFGIHMPGIVENDAEIYLKFQVMDGFIIITIHESERPLKYPYMEA